MSGGTVDLAGCDIETGFFVHQGHLIDEALKKGVREALVRQKKEGRRVVVNRDGLPVSVDPNELDLD